MQAVGAAALADEMPALKSHLTRWLFYFQNFTAGL